METEATLYPLWAARGISKSFPGVQALRDVSLDIRAGEVHALLGENGSGKSTLAKCLAGVHAPDEGEIFHRGAPIVFRNPAEARARGIATIYQEFSLVSTLTVAENVFLGNYRRTGGGRIHWRAMRDETRAVLRRLSLNIDPDAVVKTLSVSGQQMVEIAKAISMDSSLLIMDEPTASLGLAETQHLMESIRRLTAQGKAVIYISHRLDEVFQIADRVTVLKDGQHVATAPVSALKMTDVVRMMVGFDIKRHYPKQRNVREEACLEVEALSSEGGVDDVSFTIRAGEVLGLGGMVGAGRTGIARAIYGLDRVTAGRIRLAGREVRFRSPRAAIAHGVGLIPENRKVDGTFFNFDGPKNITVARMRDVASGPLLRLSREAEVGRSYVRKLSISPSALERSVRYLSGGNQQKVIIARWLFARARLLIMDEPTQGIDIGAKLDVYQVINELTASGIAVLLISSDFPELLAMSDRVALVRHGRILGVAEAHQLSQYDLVSRVSGVEARMEAQP